MKRITYAGVSDVGNRRQNEDGWFADASKVVFLVADGIGGHAAGDLASRIVVEILPKLLRQKLGEDRHAGECAVSAWVENCLRKLSEHLHQASKEKRLTKGMGAAVVRDRYAIISHLGDCRGYLLNNGELAQLTSDYTLTQLLLDADEINVAEALAHPGRHQLTRFVGRPTETLPETRVVPLSPSTTPCWR